MPKISDLFVNITTKGAEKTKATIESIGGSVKKFGLLTKAAFALAVTAVAKFTFELVKLSSQIKFTTASFDALTENSDRLRVELKEATKGMASDLELMAAANKALLLGIKENQLPDLFRFAAALAKPSGRTITEAIDDISTGLGRQSRLILDNLGIVVKMEQAQKNLAKQLGKTVEALTDEERALAFLNEGITQGREKAEKLGEKVEKLVDPSQKLAASWKDFKNSLADASTSLGVVLDKISLLLDKMTASKKRADEVQEAYERVAKSGFKFLVDKLKELDHDLDNSVINRRTYQKAVLDLEAQLVSFQGTVLDTSLAADDLSSSMNDASAAFEFSAGVTKELSDAAKVLQKEEQDRLALLNAQSDEEARLIELKQRHEKEDEALIERMRTMNLTMEEQIYLQDLLNQRQEKEINNLKNLIALNDRLRESRDTGLPSSLSMSSSEIFAREKLEAGRMGTKNLRIALRVEERNLAAEQARNARLRSAE